MIDLVVASRNRGKLAEFSDVLAPLGFRVAGIGPDAVEPEETGTTLEENALIKAQDGARVLRAGCVADDSGLFVDALEGRPGVFSARYAGAGASDADNRKKLLQEMLPLVPEERAAEFRAVICAIVPELWPTPRYFAGVVRGRIALAERGSAGFGYDSLFVPDEGDGRTFAEMGPREKNAISHRGRALAAMVAAISAARGVPPQL